MTSSLPSQLVIAAGTYEGVLAGWELQQVEGNHRRKSRRNLKLTFATPVHDGSLRCLSLAASTDPSQPGALVSCGYDETLKTHDWHKHKTSIGEVRTPADFGTPTSSCFAPPPSILNQLPSTHCVLGFSTGKIVLYKKRDWSIQHVLAGHEGGVSSLAVHPSGKMALSGGQSDGKLKLWDLTKGRLAYVVKNTPKSADRQTGKSRFDPVTSLIWSRSGDAYAWGHGSHVTVRDVASGKELLDVELPSRANGITLMTTTNKDSDYYGALFVAAACNDGSLPVLAVQDVDGEDDTRRAILAIEPVDSPVAGEERFKCIQSIQDFYVATANSAGVVSIMNLEGAIRMIVDPNQATEDESGSEDEPQESNNDEKASGDEDEEEELAVEILESTRLGTGARITSLAVWSHNDLSDEQEEDEPEEEEDEEKAAAGEGSDKGETVKGMKRKSNEIEIGSEAIEKARALVKQAKKRKHKKDKKKKAKSKELTPN